MNDHNSNWDFLHSGAHVRLARCECHLLMFVRVLEDLLSSMRAHRLEYKSLFDTDGKTMPYAMR